jgi:hypothetical protein
MEKKKVLIQVATEFHYMVALSLIEKKYAGSDYDIHIILIENPLIKSRLAAIGSGDNFTYHRVSYNHQQNQVFPDVLKLLSFVKQHQFFHFVSFLYSDPLFVYFTWYFKSKNTKTFLAPDGMCAYVKFTASNLRSRFYNTRYSYRFYKNHGMPFPKLWFSSWDFGANGWYDEIYAYSSSLPYIKRNVKITEIDYTLSENSVTKLRQLFGTSFKDIPTLENVVLIINEKQKTIQYEKTLIELIYSIWPQKQILFKKHPNQPAENLEWLKQYPGVHVITAVFPVELLIASLKKSVIVSSYSNSAMYHNPTCHYFWTYPIVISSGELVKPVKRFHPKPYIKVVNNFDEFKQQLQKIN